jgi:hypothetical protein
MAKIARSYRGLLATSSGLRDQYLSLAAAALDTMVVKTIPMSQTMPPFIGSLARITAVSIQRGFDAANQDRASERFGQEANRSDLQRPVTNSLIGKRRNKNERHVVALSAQMLQKVQTAHAWHLHIRNDTRRVVRVGRLQEVLGRSKCTYNVPMRAEEIVGSCADGCIVVNDGNTRKR